MNERAYLIKKIEASLEVLVHTVCNLAHFKAIVQYSNESRQIFWRLVQRNFVDAAILAWCKVFANKGDDLHFKHLYPKETAFLKELVAALGMSLDTFRKYIELVKQDRDRLLAHGSLKPPKHKSTPEADAEAAASPSLFGLNPIQASTCYYYGVLLQRLQEIGGGTRDWPDDLYEYYKTSHKQACRFAKKAYGSTRRMRGRDGGPSPPCW